MAWIQLSRTNLCALCAFTGLQQVLLKATERYNAAVDKFETQQQQIVVMSLLSSVSIMYLSCKRNVAQDDQDGHERPDYIPFVILHQDDFRQQNFIFAYTPLLCQSYGQASLCRVASMYLYRLSRLSSALDNPSWSENYRLGRHPLCSRVTEHAEAVCNSPTSGCNVVCSCWMGTMVYPNESGYTIFNDLGLVVQDLALRRPSHIALSRMMTAYWVIVNIVHASYNNRIPLMPAMQLLRRDGCCGKE